MLCLFGFLGLFWIPMFLFISFLSRGSASHGLFQLQSGLCTLSADCNSGESYKRLALEVPDAAVSFGVAMNEASPLCLASDLHINFVNYCWDDRRRKLGSEAVVLEASIKLRSINV